MVKKNEKAKKIILSLSFIILFSLVLVFFGKSLAFFNYQKKGETVNVVTFKGLDIDILNSSNNSLSLVNAYPMYDSEGMEQTPLEFRITNQSSNAIDYTLKVETDIDKLDECVIQGTNTPCTGLSTNYIKYSYRINNGSWSEPDNLGSNSNVVFSDAILGNSNVSVSIKIWIDSTAPNEIQGQVFFGKLVLEATKTTSNKVKVTFDDNINLVYGLEDVGETQAAYMKYSISNGVVTVTSTGNNGDGWGFTDGRVYLEQGKTYIFNCDTNGTWGGTVNSDTVESFFMKDGVIATGTYFRINSNNNFEFTPPATGEYWLRLDVNKDGETYNFWNISVKEKKDYGVKHVTVGQTYGDLPTPTREGYTFKGWNGKNIAEDLNYDNYLIHPHYMDRTSEELKVDNGMVYFRINGLSSSEIDTYWSIYSNKKFFVEKGKSYTLSFLVRSEAGRQQFLAHSVRNSGYFGLYSEIAQVDAVYGIEQEYIEFLNDGNWHRVSFTMNVDNYANNLYLRLGYDLPNLIGDGSYFDIAQVQLEEDSTATAYEPYYITSSTEVVQTQNHTLTAIWEKN